MRHEQAEILQWALCTTFFYPKCIKAVFKKQRVQRDGNKIIFQAGRDLRETPNKNPSFHR